MGTDTQGLDAHGNYPPGEAELSKKLDEIIIYLDKITLRLERMEERQKAESRVQNPTRPLGPSGF